MSPPPLLYCPPLYGVDFFFLSEDFFPYEHFLPQSSVRFKNVKMRSTAQACSPTPTIHGEAADLQRCVLVFWTCQNMFVSVCVCVCQYVYSE